MPAAGSVRRALERAGIHTHALPLRRGPGPGDARAARALRQLASRGGYDVVHAHSSKAGALARLALGADRRLVYSPHCFAFASGVERSSRALSRAVEQLLVSRSDAIVVQSEWERWQAARLRGALGRTWVVRNGVPACPPDEADEELVRFRGDRPLAGLVAVLRPQKDPLALVRAAALLRARGGLPGRIAIVGNGWLEQEVRAEISGLRLDGEVGWFPFRPPAARYLRALDLFVLPSRWESLPLAPIEAMACGVPVLATRVGGVPEIVEDGRSGELVEPGRPDRLADGMAGLLGDRERLGAMGAYASQVARERFPADRMVTEIEDVYRSVAR